MPNHIHGIIVLVGADPWSLSQNPLEKYSKSKLIEVK
jgi:hypothetical protein